MKIYTRTGDKGETSLFGGKRIAKASDRVEAYGTVDELNSNIGLAIAFVDTNKTTPVVDALVQIQQDLFDIGSYLSMPSDIQIDKGKMLQKKLPLYLSKRVVEMEQLIDTLTKDLEPMTTFILPGGGKAGAQLHIARTVARRAERRIVALATGEDIAKEVLVFMNRLSDLLFTMARFVNTIDQQKETKWSSNNTR